MKVDSGRVRLGKRRKFRLRVDSGRARLVEIAVGRIRNYIVEENTDFD